MKVKLNTKHSVLTIHNHLQSLLSHVSRTTKNTLNRLGVFTVSSFHAYVCARSPSLLSNLLAGRGATKRRAPLLSRSNSASSRRSLHVSSSERENERTAKISLPDNQVRFFAYVWCVIIRRIFPSSHDRVGSNILLRLFRS